MKFKEFLKKSLSIEKQDDSQDRFKELKKIKSKAKSGYFYTLNDGTKLAFIPEELYVYPFENKESIHKEFLKYMFPGHCFSIDKPSKCVYMCVYDGSTRKYILVEGEGEKELTFD